MRSNLFGQLLGARGEILGCDSCPLDKEKRIRKVKGLERVTGRRAMIWAQSPDEADTRRGIQFAGSVGEFVWKELGKYGLKPADFDVQHVLRCRPLLDKEEREHDPTKRELGCCSVYNDDALRRNRGAAAVHLILGDVAGLQLLGKAFKKDAPVAWHAPWDAYVVLNFLPSRLLAKGGTKAGWEYFTWKDRLRAVKACVDHPGRWGFVKAQNYSQVRTHAEFDAMEKALLHEARQKRRVSVDVETGFVDGKAALLMTGFGTGRYEGEAKDAWKGKCWSVVLDHPASGYSARHARDMTERVKRLVEDADLKKTLQHGSSDKGVFKSNGMLLRGYDYDTNLGTYLRYSFLKSCGLEALTYRFFPEFADYKDTVEEWVENFADAPLDRLTLRNCGDCDITQRLEQRFSSQVNQALMKVYIHAGITLAKMETRGPVLDWVEWKKAKEILPKMVESIDRNLQRITGNMEFKATDRQVAEYVYDVLGSAPDEELGRSTVKDVLSKKYVETGNPFFDLVPKRRTIAKLENTYIDGYAKSARVHDGELRTIWWLTGAVTGRLRSGQGGDERKGIINLQNIHGLPLLQNMLVSDVNWRKALDERD